MKQFKSLIGALSVLAMFVLPTLGRSQARAVPVSLQEKAQAMEQVAAQNEQSLHQYQWIETTTVTMNGTPRSPRQMICHYTPYGTLTKTPMGAQGGPPPVPGGPLRRHIAEKKIDKVETELAVAHELTAKYLPLNPEALKQALRIRRIDFEHEPTGDTAVLINDYVKAGDQVTLDVDTATLQLRRILVKSYFDSPKDVFTVTVQFAALADGTTYPSTTTIEAPTKKLSITTVSSTFSRPVQ